MQQDSENLKVSAEAGDAVSQLKLGLKLLAQSEFKEAIAWLHRAAEQKVPRAAETIGMLLLTGQGVQRNPELAFEYFRSAALAGDAQALYRCAELMARGVEVNQDLVGALDCLITSAKQGYPLSLRAVAMFWLAEHNTASARKALLIAACQNDPHSQYLLANLCDDPSEALHWLGLAANAGLSLALERFKQATQDGLLPKVPTGIELAAVLAQLQDELDQLKWPELPAWSKVELNQSPLVAEVDGFFSDMESDYLIHQAQFLLEPAQVITEQGGHEHHHFRTGSTAALGSRNLDFVATWLNARVNRFLSVQDGQAEPACVLHYATGQQYKLHLDVLPPDSEFTSVTRGGQRMLTALVYLNEGFSGGSTLFPKLGLDIPARRGKLLVFENCSANGDVYENSLHAGSEIESGDKWVLSRWFRQTPFQYR
ncbi:2OG-Fe(II) oxygenase [Rheinheimera sp.]|uniref:2OG-Fe(II) oxygenase n=1 Tax=Rheinheimera sp. TaxID=1869214 RepID=UPI003AF61382